jgi:hypothetical protein
MLRGDRGRRGPGGLTGLTQGDNDGATPNIGCRITRSTGQSIPASAGTTINFDVDIYDTDAMHDTLVQNNRVYVKTPGVYLITFCLTWEANAGGQRVTAIIKNNTTWIAVEGETGVAADTCDQSVATTDTFIVDDFFSGIVYQTDNAARIVTSVSQYTPVLTAQLLVGT